jgi:hypothetical protein
VTKVVASWTFVVDYGSQYPALKSSVLSLLVFSEHSISGTEFAGVLDVTASGAALATMGLLLNVTSIAMKGSVTNADNTLTVSLANTNPQVFIAGISANVPLIASRVTSSGMSVNTVTTTQDDPDEGPKQDDFTLYVTLQLSSAASVTITTQVPMNGGIFILEGTFSNLGITLADVGFLMGNKSTGDQWFPGKELGPYYQRQPALNLLGITLTLYAALSPFRVSVSAVEVGIGITGIDLYKQRLYLNPIGVWVTVADPLGSAELTWAIEGALALCNYERPGEPEHPDIRYDFAMDLTNFAISGEYERAAGVTINTMLQDLLGSGTDIGLPPKLTLDKFDFEASADKSSGTLTEFSMDIAMSGGFGLLANLDLQEISVSFAYSA